MDTHEEPVDFFLGSSEQYDLAEPRRCEIIKRLPTPRREDFLLVSISPVLIGQKYGLGGEDIGQVLLAARFAEDSLFPISLWPMPVYVARVLVASPEKLDEIHVGQFELIGWAELYRTEAEALRAAE